MQTNIFIIELDSVRRYRNKQEYRTVNRAKCTELGLEVVSDQSVIVLLCKKMRDLGIVGQVRVCRQGKEVFAAENLNIWADNKFGKGTQPEHLINAR